MISHQVMYQQPKLAYASTDSVRRLSSNNPFRQVDSRPVLSPTSGSFYEHPRFATRSSGSLNIHSQLTTNNFDEWVDKNKQLLDIESDEEAGHENTFVDMGAPQFPHKVSRADSDSSVNYGNGYVYFVIVC